MKCLILAAPDDPMQSLRALLGEALPEWNVLPVVHKTTCAQELCRRESPQLLLVDLDTPDAPERLRWVKELLQQHDADPEVVFLHAQDCSLTEALLDYAYLPHVAKPIDPAAIRRLLEQFLPKPLHPEPAASGLLQPQNGTPGLQTRFPLPVPLKKGVIELIPTEQIAWLESRTVVTAIHLQQGETVHAMRHIGHFRELLIPEYPFFQISQSAIVYLPFVRRYLPSERKVVLKNDLVLTASKRGGAELNQFLRGSKNHNKPGSSPDF